MPGARYLIERLIQTVPVLLLVSLAIFAMIHLAPGDPVSVLAGDQGVDPRVTEELRRQLHLDQPFLIQYARWLSRAVRGDFGFSYATRQPVMSAIAYRLPVTLQLSVFAMIIALVVAIPLGAAAAVYRGSFVDYVNQGFAMLAGSMPAFWLGILLILLFAQKLQWLPASGYVAFRDDPVANLKHMFLPAVTLSTAFAAVVCRVVRASMLDVLREDYVRTARAKGLSERAVIVSHALRTTLLPTITIIGMETGNLLAGAVITETIFAVPGMGRLLVTAVSSRDFPIVQGATLLLVTIMVMSNFLADIAYGFADPRVGKAR